MNRLAKLLAWTALALITLVVLRFGARLLYQYGEYEPASSDEQREMKLHGQ